MPRRPVFLAILCAAAAVYATMVLWTLPRIAADAGGLVPFDMRPGGYDVDAARAFLTALGDAGRSLYLGPQHWLDTAYPGLLAAVLCLALWRLSRGAPRWLRWALLVLPLSAAGFDWWENALVRDMLLTAPGQLEAGAVAAASRATVAKSVLTTVTAMLVLALLLRLGWRRWRMRAGR